jgi:hypothetical protein
VGVCYRVTQNLKRGAPWPRDFITTVAHRVREDSVRFVGGVFECPSQQVTQLACSCGAVAPFPFAQVFRETSLGITMYFLSPALIFVIGEAKNAIRHRPRTSPRGLRGSVNKAMERPRRWCVLRASCGACRRGRRMRPSPTSTRGFLAT